MKLKLAALAAIATLLAGCSSIDLMAPIEDRSIVNGTPRAGTSAETVALGENDSVRHPKHLVVERPAQSSGQFHTVVQGDTLYNIGVRYGVNYREIMALNGIKDPTTVALGQRIEIPMHAEEAVPSKVTTETVAGGAVVTAQETAPASATRVEVEVAKRPDTPEEAAQKLIDAQRQAAEAASRGEVELIWPARGDVIASFKETKTGIDISGNLGDPVVAVLDGTVHYVGDNTPGYGNFLIIRHNFSLPGKTPVPLLTVYGNNSKILVHQNENVRAGQVIAEMGKSDSPIVKLRFEVRQGKPLDPIDYLKKK